MNQFIDSVPQSNSSLPSQPHLESIGPFKLLSNQIINARDHTTSRQEEVPIWVIPMLITYLIAYLIQLGLFGWAISLSYLSKAGWIIRKNRFGLLLPNTRLLIAFWSSWFTTIQFTDTIFLLQDATSATMARATKERLAISGFAWLTLWQAGWAVVWGILASSIVVGYHHGGFIVKLMNNIKTVKVLNVLFISIPAGAVLTHVVTFAWAQVTHQKIVVFYQYILTRLAQLSESYDPQTFQPLRDLQPEIINSMRIEVLLIQFVEVTTSIFYIRLGWSIFLVMVMLPLGILHIFQLAKVGDVVSDRMVTNWNPSKQIFKINSNDHHLNDSRLAQMRKSRHQNSSVSVQSHSSGRLEFVKSHWIISAILAFSHILVYTILTVSYVPALKSQTKGALERGKILRLLAYIGKGLFAVIGIWSSYVLLQTSRQKHEEELSHQNIIIFARKESMTSMITTSPSDYKIQFDSNIHPSKEMNEIKRNWAVSDHQLKPKKALKAFVVNQPGNVDLSETSPTSQIPNSRRDDFC